MALLRVAASACGSSARRTAERPESARVPTDVAHVSFRARDVNNALQRSRDRPRDHLADDVSHVPFQRLRRCLYIAQASNYVIDHSWDVAIESGRRVGTRPRQVEGRHLVVIGILLMIRCDSQVILSIATELEAKKVSETLEGDI